MTRAPALSESEIQTRVINWCRSNIGWKPCLEWVHSNGNGAWYGADRMAAIKHSARMKREGQVPGICDLFLPFPARGYHGMYLELKRPGALNEVRPGQADFMAYAESVGYLCNVFDSSEDAIEAIEYYLGE